MSTTKHWSIAHTCRRLAEEVATLSQDAANADMAAVVEHLRAAADGLQAQPEVAIERDQLDELSHSTLMAALEPEDFGRSGFQPGPRHTIAFRAAAGFAETPDLITFLSSSQQTGILEVVTETECFVLEFQDGDIAHAHSDGAPEGQRLGDILVEQGSLTRDELDAELAKEERVRLGLRLWESGQVSNSQLIAALAQQIRMQFARLFELPPVQFTFWSGPPVRAQRQMRLSVTGLILDGARVVDERAVRS